LEEMAERKKFKVKSLGATPGLQLKNISTKPQFAQKAPVQTISTNSLGSVPLESPSKFPKENIKISTKLSKTHFDKYLM
jgi:hypothetical protein